MTRSPARWVLASGNPGKVAEFQSLLGGRGVLVVPQRELGIDDADEPHPTFVENALAKARHAAAASGLPALADDSGISVAGLGGAPGVRSARFALDDWPAGQPLPQGRVAIDAANNARLVRAAASLAGEVRCCYVCVIVWLRAADDPLPLIAEGRWSGRLLPAPRGAFGFGYDPHFLPDGSALTAAELEPAAKNRVSHRGLALARLLERLPDAG